MRLRNVKNAENILEQSSYVVKEIKQPLFSNSNPIYLEIGMGKGDFIIENAMRYPNINFIGIEKYASVMVRAVQKLEEINLPNLKFICTDAKNVNTLFQKNITLIYLNFSDPWPKVRHSMRRLSSRVFLEKYDKIFKGEKNIYLRTDNRDLFTFSLESFSQYGYVLHDINLNLHEIDQPDIITTEYEDKFVEAGLPIYQVVATKE